MAEDKGYILVVDDEEDILFTLEDLLEEEGYKVEVESDPKKALEKAKKNMYDLIITDLKMPKLSGEELIKKIREFNQITSIIVMTAYGTVDTAVSCMKHGAFHYISKPIDFNDPFTWNIINEAIKKAKVIKENLKLKEEIKK